MAIETGSCPADIDERIDGIIEAVEPCSDALSIQTRSLRLRFNVETDCLEQACVSALEVFKKAVSGEQPVKFEGRTVEDLEKALAESMRRSCLASRNWQK